MNNGEYQYLAEFGAYGLILLLVVLAIKKQCGADFFMIFLLLLEGKFMWESALNDVLYVQSWGSFEIRKFIFAAVSYTPGVLAVWLALRVDFEPAPKTAETDKPG